jgi:hypothetical protein
MTTSVKTRKRKRTIMEWFRAVIAGLIPTIAVGLWIYWGNTQNTSGANGEKLVTIEKRMDKVETNLEASDKKTAEWKVDLGVVVNEINSKLDTVLDGQRKQLKFNNRLVEGNAKLTRSLQDIFNFTRQSYISNEESQSLAGCHGGTGLQ